MSKKEGIYNAYSQVTLKMNEESLNRSFVVLLIAAIIVSVGSTIINLSSLQRIGGITGFAQSAQGTVTFSVNESVSIALLDDNVDFGQCLLNTSGIVSYQSNEVNGTTVSGFSCDGLSDGVDYMVLENDGNVDVLVNLSSNVSGTEFINSPTSRGAFWFMATENETNSCGSGLANSWVNITQAAQNYGVCSNLTNINDNDALNIWFRLDLPDDTAVGTRDAQITFSAVKV